MVRLSDVVLLGLLRALVRNRARHLVEVISFLLENARVSSDERLFPLRRWASKDTSLAEEASANIFINHPRLHSRTSYNTLHRADRAHHF